MPRIGFWIFWTAWLWLLQSFVLEWAASANLPVLLIIVGLPLLITWIGSRLARNPKESPSSLFWKGAIVSCLLGIFAGVVFASIDSIRGVMSGVEILIATLAFCGYMVVRGGGVKRIKVTQGELFDRVQAIARWAGVSVNRIVVITTPSNAAGAFAHHTGAILLTDRLLRVLSRRETDAVIAHEAAHLCRHQRFVLSLLPLSAGMAILVANLWPGAKTTAPFWPILTVLLWRALRRTMEYDADATAIRATRDPESLISALTRISRVSDLPLHWGKLAGIFIGHPPMTARFRAIGRRSGISASRIEEIVSMANTVPALPGYDSPVPEPAPLDSAILAAYRDRLSKQLRTLATLFPIVAGIAAAYLARFWLAELAGGIAFATASIIAAMFLYWIAYEVTVGSARQKLRRQLDGSALPGGYFVGLSTAAEPRVFDGMYHYDLGIVRMNGAALHFVGARGSFSIASSQVHKIWLAAGPPHWTPRKVVCLEYQLGEASLHSVVSLQSMDRWFWPWTTSAANQLFQILTKWSENPAASAAEMIPPPQVSGTILPPIRFAQLAKPIATACLYSLCGSSFLSALPPMSVAGIFTPFFAPVVAAALMLFAYAPQLERTPPRSSNPAKTSSPPSAYPSTE
jgi:Zn-dependent protease with chaperone function